MASNPLLKPDEPEEDFETSLRPITLDDFVGQPKVIKNLSVFIEAARKREEALDHVLFSGPPGLGKTTLAYIVGNEMQTHVQTTSGPVLEKPGDLAGMLTKLEEGDVLFIDEIHRLNPVVEEYLYSAMEDYCLDIVIDTGPNARSIQVELKPFTLIGATTRKGLLTAPLRARFSIDLRLDYYDAELLKKIAIRTAGILNCPISEDGAIEIARRSRGTPRIVNKLLRRTRDFAQVDNKQTIDKETADQALNALDVDQNGLDEMDIRILSVLIQNYKGGPAGLGTVSVAVGEEKGTIEEVYEPFLIQEGFLQRTPKGRVATARAFEYLGMQPPATSSDSPDLFNSGNR